MPLRLTVLLDDELARALEHHVSISVPKMGRAGTVRDLLRRSLGVVAAERPLGFREGFFLATSRVRKAVSEAFRAAAVEDDGGEGKGEDES